MLTQDLIKFGRITDMKTSIHEKFHRFLLRHNLTIVQVQEIITEYANTTPELARTFFKEKYGISEHVFYKCRDYAVICCIVDDKVCKLLRDKACFNSKTHNADQSCRASAIHHSDLLSQREEYLLSFLDADIRDIARKYAGGMSAAQIGLAYETGKYGINRLLIRGITDLIIDKKTLDAIFSRMPTSKQWLNKVLKSRKENLENLLYMYTTDVSILQYKIDNYSLYYRDEMDKPSLEELERQLQLAKKRYEIALEL